MAELMELNRSSGAAHGSSSDRGRARKTSPRNLPIRRKLLLVTTGVLVLAFVITAAGLLVAEWMFYREHLTAELSAQARVIERNCTRLLRAGDREGARNLLSTIQAEDAVILAMLHDKHGQPFARYVRPGAPTPEHHTASGDAHFNYGSKRVNLFVPVMDGGERLGTVHLRASLMPLYWHIGRTAVAVLIVLLVALGLAYVLFRRLHCAVTDPLVKLSDTIETVTRKRDYSLRVQSAGADEVGRLVVGFNEMLERIQARDRHLEDEVKQRTARLAASEQRYRDLVALAPEIIAINDLDGRILFANEAAVRATGAADANALEGRSIFEFIHPDSAELSYQALASARAGNVQERVTGVKLMLPGAREMEVEVAAAPITYEGRPAVQIIIHDVTERVRAEDRIKRSLAEKDVLLREIHHRVKNNLQIIVSLLNLEARRLEDPQAVAALTDSRSRVDAMALVHDQLYQAQDLGRIDAAQYLGELTRTLLYANARPDAEIVPRLDLAPIEFDIETAIPLGLVLNELLANALEHAFPTGGRGHVYVRLQITDPGRAELAVGDDGKGFPADFDWTCAETLGLRLSRTLVEQQLQGTMELEKGPGATFHIRFPLIAEPTGQPGDSAPTTPGSAGTNRLFV